MDDPHCGSVTEAEVPGDSTVYAYRSDTKTQRCAEVTGPPGNVGELAHSSSN